MSTITGELGDFVAELSLSRLTVRAGNQEYLRETTEGASNHLFSFADTAEFARALVPEMRCSMDTVEELTATIESLETCPDLVPLVALAAHQNRS